MAYFELRLRQYISGSGQVGGTMDLNQTPQQRRYAYRYSEVDLSI